jgi:AcrR family transcriptional regulator
MNVADVRRQPRQERSRIRVESILEVALELVVEQGSEALAMREVARRAGVQISSVYAYFPSKAAIIRELAKRNLERVRMLLQDEVAALMSEHDGPPPVAEAVNRVVDAYFAHYRDQPDAVAVWAGAQGDHGLRELDMDDTRSTAEFLVMPLMQILRRTERDDVFPLALLLTEVTGSAARLALAVESPLREQLVEQHKAMLTATLEAHRAAGTTS